MKFVTEFEKEDELPCNAVDEELYEFIPHIKITPQDNSNNNSPPNTKNSSTDTGMPGNFFFDLQIMMMISLMHLLSHTHVIMQYDMLVSAQNLFRTLTSLES